MSIGNIFKQKRKEKGFTLEKVSELIGIDATYLSRIEKGTRTPQPQHIAKLSKLFSIPEKEFNIIYLTDTIIKQYGDEKYILDALKRASSIIKQSK